MTVRTPERAPEDWTRSPEHPDVAVATADGVQRVLAARVRELGYDSLDEFLQAAQDGRLEDPLAEELWSLFGPRLVSD